MSLVILDPGGSALVQDLGRPGLAHLGVARSGALDRSALELANRLVANDEGAAGIEIGLGGFRARVEHETWIAVTGAWGPIRVDGEPIAPYTAARVPAGAMVELDLAERGVRYVLAIRGGVEVPPVLGSRSRDTLAGLGPAPLVAGQRVRIGREPAASVPLLDEPAAFAPPADDVTLELLPGPRADWFTDAAHELLYDASWSISTQTGRIGARLDGPMLERRIAGELSSEATVPGSVQVSTSGQPIVLLADRPVTGGYPVIAIVAPASLDAVAQLRPGQTVRFRHAR